jgi:trehalose 6-phosphate phosphatase
MKNVLQDCVTVLDEVAREGMLLVFDFDGTLAPIVDDPASAELRCSTRKLLRLASLLYPCAVLSGRARADLLTRLEGIPLVAVVGNHGAEAGFGPVERSLRAAVVAWKRAIEAHALAVPGVTVEDKGLSIAIHYRNAASRSAARRTLHGVAASLPGARVLGGRAVVNVVPAGTHDKGAAVAQLLGRTDRRRALFVGDGVADEDAFRSRSVAVGVRVGRTHLSAAQYYVPSQADVDELLRTLVRSRRRQDGLHEDVAGLERLMESC